MTHGKTLRLLHLPSSVKVSAIPVGPTPEAALGRSPVNPQAMRRLKAPRLLHLRHRAALTAGQGGKAPIPATGAATADGRAAEGHLGEVATQGGDLPLLGGGARRVAE